ncbi:hypothetical protein EVAR_98864_1 [Eumeta japonica]|uniref:Uncharacterized protein n=1 Tax=Eumeta variegata TaxID=151549 RepID=A0A4C1Z9C6_EUMVA|nr:hypothetical protein EVAR_98864_1 [Eumeta japonica]
MDLDPLLGVAIKQETPEDHLDAAPASTPDRSHHVISLAKSTALSGLTRFSECGTLRGGNKDHLCKMELITYLTAAILCGALYYSVMATPRARDSRLPAGHKPRVSGGNNSVYREFRFDNEMTQL